MEWVRNHIILKTKNLEYGTRRIKKVCQTYWFPDNIVGLNYKQKEQHSPARLLRGALCKNFRDFK